MVQFWARLPWVYPYLCLALMWGAVKMMGFMYTGFHSSQDSRRHWREGGPREERNQGDFFLSLLMVASQVMTLGPQGS